MQSLRQLGGGILIALISILLVIGGISLALAETLPPQATPTQIPPTTSLDFPTATFTGSPSVSVSSTTPPSFTPIVVATETALATNTLFVQASCTPPSGWVRVTTTSGDTVYGLAQRYKTTAENLGAANCLSSFDIPVGYIIYVPPVPTVTVIPCGPPVGYVRRHVVRPGENLFRIALSYGVTYPVLQRANCMGSSTTIYVGQILWVPNVPTRTPVPGVTMIPNFPTATSTNTLVPGPPTFTPSNTSVPQYP
ncbi:MAG TPA: LysM peptidoglycan-binding domain-containing protein [Anaerolineales bacterium]|nr:LysM peptidoglycan-binding domain-containing protein [Anaerolineales bacterium]